MRANRDPERLLEATGFQFLFDSRETFQNWRGSKVVTTRRFRPSP